MAIQKLLDASGQKGFEMISALMERQYDEDAAWDKLSHEDRMAVLIADREKRDSLLADIERRKQEELSQ